jgi:hypothetical protein
MSEGVDPPKRRTTKENANSDRPPQVTEYKCIERQEKINCGTGPYMAAADRSIVIQTKVDLPAFAGGVEAGPIRPPHLLHPDYCVTGRHIL